MNALLIGSPNLVVNFVAECQMKNVMAVYAARALPMFAANAYTILTFTKKRSRKIPNIEGHCQMGFTAFMFSLMEIV
ncbi:hypothetical protein NBRC116602_27060 [Hyphomicrobiales bacterium 4NK60-0047b]